MSRLLGTIVLWLFVVYIVVGTFWAIVYASSSPDSYAYALGDRVVVYRQCTDLPIQSPLYKGTIVDWEHLLIIKVYWVNCHRV